MLNDTLVNLLLRGLLFAALLALAASPMAHAEDEGAEEEAAASAPASKGGKTPRTMGKDKVGIEAYLKHRLGAIKTHHKARTDFIAREGQLWQEFWNKVKDERNLFEVRIARQRLDLFESLGSLEKKEHPAAIADFERLQNNVIRAFENSQKTKMFDFFAERDRRLKDFAAKQERERTEFALEVESSWQQLKNGLPATPSRR